MVDTGTNQRIVDIEVTADLIKALAGAVARAYDKYVSTATCRSCSEKDRGKVKAEYETLRGLYERITDDRNHRTGADFISG